MENNYFELCAEPGLCQPFNSSAGSSSMFDHSMSKFEAKTLHCKFSIDDRERLTEQSMTLLSDVSLRLS